MWKTLERWLSLASIPLAVLSLITLFNRMANVELVGIYNDFITFYQHVTHAVVGFLPSLFHWDVPGIVKDYWALSFWMTGVQISAMHKTEPLKLNIGGIVGKWLFILFLGYSFLGLLFGLSMIGSSLFASDAMLMKATDTRINMFGYMRTLRLTFLLSLLLAAVFFAMNAYAPGLGG